jgi:hypothetical protein
MTQERLNEINALVESYRQTDGYDEDAQKTALVAELLAEVKASAPELRERRHANAE